MTSKKYPLPSVPSPAYRQAGARGGEFFGGVLTADQEILLRNGLHFPQGLLLLPCNQNVDRTGEDIKEYKAEEDDNGLHDDHNHR